MPFSSAVFETMVWGPAMVAAVEIGEGEEKRLSKANPNNTAKHRFIGFPL
jgi:hypothetical protein